MVDPPLNIVFYFLADCILLCAFAAFKISATVFNGNLFQVVLQQAKFCSRSPQKVQIQKALSLRTKQWIRLNETEQMNSKGPPGAVPLPAPDSSRSPLSEIKGVAL